MGSLYVVCTKNWGCLLEGTEKVLFLVVVILSRAKNLSPIATCRRSFTPFKMTNETFSVPSFTNVFLGGVDESQGIKKRVCQKSLLAGDSLRCSERQR